MKISQLTNNNPLTKSGKLLFIFLDNVFFLQANPGNCFNVLVSFANLQETSW